MTCYKKHHELKKWQDKVRIQLGKYLVSGKADTVWIQAFCQNKVRFLTSENPQENRQGKSDAAELPVGKN